MSWLLILVIFLATSGAVLTLVSPITPAATVIKSSLNQGIPSPAAHRVGPGAVLGTGQNLVPRKNPGAFRRLVRTSRAHILGSGADSRTAAEDHSDFFAHLAVLLRSGRSQQQVWKDLHRHWRVEARSAELERLITEVSQAASTGRGAGTALANLTTSDVNRSNMDGPLISPSGQRLIGQLLSAVRLSETTGIALAAVIEELAHACETDADLEKTVQTAIAGPRLTQVVLALLPLAAVGVGQLIGAQPLAVLLGSGLGFVCLVGGLLFMGIGILWSRSMIAKVTIT